MQIETAQAIACYIWRKTYYIWVSKKAKRTGLHSTRTSSNAICSLGGHPGDGWGQTDGVLGLPREAAESPSLGISKSLLDTVLGNLLWMAPREQQVGADGLGRPLPTLTILGGAPGRTGDKHKSKVGQQTAMTWSWGPAQEH